MWEPLGLKREPQEPEWGPLAQGEEQLELELARLEPVSGKLEPESEQLGRVLVSE